MRPVLLALLLTACTAPNHLGNPLTLPVRGLGTAFENVAYNRQRAMVKTWIIENEPGLRAERFDGPLMADLLGTVPAPVREKVRGEVKDAARHADFPERATVIVMVHR